MICLHVQFYLSEPKIFPAALDSLDFLDRECFNRAWVEGSGYACRRPMFLSHWIVRKLLELPPHYLHSEVSIYSIALLQIISLFLSLESLSLPFQISYEV